MLLRLLAAIVLLNYVSAIDVTCKDENGQSIDWFYLYKLPKLQEEAGNADVPYLVNGSAYVYMTETNQQWKLSDYSINDTQSLPALTMRILYNNATLKELDELGVGYVLYNDQADSVTLIKGHTKGVLIFNAQSAVWIVHSIPHYPPKINSQRYYINSSQLVYGQSMLCLSLNYDTLEQVGKQMLYNYPQVYDYFIPNSLLKVNSRVLDNILSVIKGNHVTEEPWFNLSVLQTVKNSQFLSFAKFTNFHDDLYTILVAPELKSDLATETWNNGAGTLPSNCTLDYHVYNVQTVSFDFIDVSFSVHKDHSKWGVTVPSGGKNNGTTVLCLGDINRQEEQYKRAGGTLCLLDNENIWKQYYNLVKNYDNCNP